MNRPQEQQKNKLQFARATLGAGRSLAVGSPEKAVAQLVVSGLKMASENVFYNPLANPMDLASALKQYGTSVLAWAPETLMNAIDRQFSGWSEVELAEALDHFHKTGNLKTKVPQLVREKVYAIRVIATSNTVQNEWHVFEKIGGVFNDRIAQFGTIEPMNAAECAKTVAIIESVRPDTYENEIKAYIAAACHEYGLYTAAPVKWIAMVETNLQQMNYEATQDHLDVALRDQIGAKYLQYKAHKDTIGEVDEDMVSVQAAKLLAIDIYAEEALSGQH